jgi:hypothetical protein
MVVHKALKLDPMAEQMLYQLNEHQMAGEWEVESPLNSADFTFLTPALDDEFYDFETGPVDTSSQASHFIQFS